MGLFSKDTLEEQFINAIKNKDILRLYDLLEKGVNVNTKFSSFFLDEYTALGYASMSGYDNIIDILLEHGADIEVKTLTGKTPLILAVANNSNFKVISILLSKGANINAQDNKGRTAIFYSLGESKTHITKKLLELSIDLTLKDNKENSILSYIALLDGETFTKSKRIIIEHIEKQAWNPKEKEPTKGKTSETWVKSGADNISFIGKYPSLGYELTEVFNLRSRQQIIVRKDLETKEVTMSQPVSFHDIDKHVLQNAINAFKKQGGNLDEELVLNCHKTIIKKKINP